MATSTSTDVLEEDAADLQFPKDDVNIEGDWSVEPQPLCCDVCRRALGCEAAILCSTCSQLTLCQHCFSLGLIIRGHRADHPYRVDRRHAPLFPTSDWPAESELRLLDGILEFGYGNWVDIAKRLPGRSQEEIQRHFNVYYLDNRDNLRDFPVFATRAGVSENVVYKYNAGVYSEEPPRFPPNTAQFRYFAGYNPARGDFEIEYDNGAECALSRISFSDIEEDSELLHEVQLAMVQGYNERLKERARRKRIIKTHGLLLLRKFPIILAKYDGTITRSGLERLYPFMQLVSGEAFDYLLEGLNREIELRRHFERLKVYRDNGITKFASCRVYEEQKTRREELSRRLGQISQNPTSFLRELDVDVKPMVWRQVVPGRKQAPPLDITYLPGYDKLTPAERNLCAEARIIPTSYLSFKGLLIEESVRNNGIRLATARTLIKIDVNKTRKLFNFLRDANLIVQLS